MLISFHVTVTLWCSCCVALIFFFSFFKVIIVCTCTIWLVLTLWIVWFNCELLRNSFESENGWGGVNLVFSVSEWKKGRLFTGLCLDSEIRRWENCYALLFKWRIGIPSEVTFLSKNVDFLVTLEIDKCVEFQNFMLNIFGSSESF